EERAEGVLHDRAVPGARRLERVDRVRAAEAEPPRQREELVGIARDELRLTLLDDLQLVLDVTEKAVRGGDPLHERRRDVARVRERRERLERPARPQARVFPAVHELLRLHEEFDLADAAAPELHVAARRLRRTQRRVDLPLHDLQILDRAEVEVSSVHERDELADETLAERPITADGSRLEPRRAFPRLTPGLVVGERGRQRDRHRSLAPARPEPKVDAEDDAVAGPLAERARHLLGEPGEELRERTAGRLLAVGLVDVHEVDVRAVVELLAAELPHAEDDEGPPRLAPLARE